MVELRVQRCNLRLGQVDVAPGAAPHVGDAVRSHPLEHRAVFVQGVIRHTGLDNAQRRIDRRERASTAVAMLLQAPSQALHRTPADVVLPPSTLHHVDDGHHCPTQPALVYAFLRSLPAAVSMSNNDRWDRWW